MLKSDCNSLYFRKLQYFISVHFVLEGVIICMFRVKDDIRKNSLAYEQTSYLSIILMQCHAQLIIHDIIYKAMVQNS